MSFVEILFSFRQDTFLSLLSPLNPSVLNLVDNCSEKDFGSVQLKLSNDDPITQSNNFPVGKKRPSLSASPAPKATKVKVQPSQSCFNFNALQKDLSDFNLIADISKSDLSCKMCPYVATQRGHLKVHYKLKHLGGADLVMKCQICGVSVKTKSYIKKHYMNKHNLTDTAAQNMANSSG